MESYGHYGRQDVVVTGSACRRSDGSDAYFDPVFALVTRHVMTLHNPTCIAISTEREGKREKKAIYFADTTSDERTQRGTSRC